MKLLIVGAGNIGTAIAHLFQSCSDYQVVLIDQFATNKKDKNLEIIQCDINNDIKFDQILEKYQFNAVISSLPYFCNIKIAEKAKKNDLHYFDLTEDIKTTEAIEKISANSHTAFIPQCGLAPGFINIAAHHLMKEYEKVETVLLRVGALPQNSSNALHYALTWSTDGLINEYGNPCAAIVDGKYVSINPLENNEEIILDGVTYEAFNTSGGLGTLWKSCLGKVNNLNYKTLRYPGHCEKIKFLMQDLNFNEHRSTLKKVFESTIPKTQQDIVVIHVSVTGKKNNQLIESNYTKKLYPEIINNQLLTAIQISTASSLCAVVDIVLTHPKTYQGFIPQEKFSLADLINNQFGKYYA